MITLSSSSRLPGPPSSPQSSSLAAPEIAVAALLVIAAGVLRWLASRGDFWFDEIWTWLLVQQQVASDLDVITNIRHDNNHILNSWIIYRLGPEAPLWLYRFPAVLAGTAAVALAGWQARARSRVEAVLAMLLTGWAFVLVHYSSEARGYAYLMFFMMLAYCAQASFDRAPHWRAVLIFSLACVGAFLSQLAFVFGYVAFVVWQVWSILRDPQRNRFWFLLLMHLPPVGLLMWLYAVNPFKVGGADVISTLDVIRMTLSLAIGGPEEGTFSWLAAGVAAAILICGLIWLCRHDLSEGFFFVAVMLVAPVAVMLITGYEHLLPRHLLVPMLMFQLLAARLLAVLWNRGRWGQGAVAALLMGSLAVNSIPDARLLIDHRGNYTAALQFMSDESRLPVITIGSDQVDRNSMIIDFYRKRGDLKKSHAKIPVYVPPQGYAEIRPEWFIVHSQSHDFRPLDNPPPKTGPPSGNYRLRKFYPYSTLSGWHWAVYQTDNPTPVPPEIIGLLQ